MKPRNHRPFTNFCRSQISLSEAWRLEREQDLAQAYEDLPPKGLLARGNGLSYNDCAFNSQGRILETSRLNHFLSFDRTNGVVICQGGVSFEDLLNLHPEFIPPVIPGTVKASLAGGIANDIHGKNNPGFGSLGHHILWLELNIKGETLVCSPTENQELFYASIGGLGLTGLIQTCALQMHQAPHFVQQTQQEINSWSTLLQLMESQSQTQTYQVAWLDLLNQPKALLTAANPVNTPCQQNNYPITVPKLPFRLLRPWLLKLFNQIYPRLPRKQSILSLTEFNNPLDRVNHWPRLYGSKGFYQFQGIFPQAGALDHFQALLDCIHYHRATPSLAVLKYFSRPGPGLLSFCQPGFTLAVDLLANKAAIKAIKAMNALICQIGGSVYLAKDNFLTPDQFACLYPEQARFKAIYQKYGAPMRSDLARRIGLLP